MWCIAVCYTKAGVGCLSHSLIFLSFSLSVLGRKRERFIFIAGKSAAGALDRPAIRCIYSLSRRPDFGIHSVVERCIYMSWPRAIITNISTRLLAWAHKPSSPCVCVRFSSCRRKITLTHTHRQRLRKLGGDGERHRQRAGKLCQLPKGHDHLGWWTNTRECPGNVYFDVCASQS